MCHVLAQSNSRLTKNKNVSVNLYMPTIQMNIPVQNVCILLVELKVIELSLITERKRDLKIIKYTIIQISKPLD